eukprot:845208-Rhodomonas_salina.3
MNSAPPDLFGAWPNFQILRRPNGSCKACNGKHTAHSCGKGRGKDGNLLPFPVQMLTMKPKMKKKRQHSGSPPTNGRTTSQPRPADRTLAKLPETRANQDNLGGEIVPGTSPANPSPPSVQDEARKSETTSAEAGS